MLTPANVALGCVGWEVLHRVLTLLIGRAVGAGVVLPAGSSEKLRAQGASYAVSLVHASILSARGVWHVLSLLAAPTMAQLSIPDAADGPFHAAAAATEATNIIFLSYLAYDLLHLLAAFPKLGGADTVAHHAGFIGASLVCGSHRILPFAFSWLVCGEISTIPLNARWFLLTSGRGESVALRATNLAFAGSFFLARILVYGLGLWHLWVSREALLGLERLVARPLLLLVIVLLVGGYGLNLVWMRKIFAMATKKTGRKRAD